MEIIKSNAKINLGLNIINRLENGYHELDMIMVPINFNDILEIEYFDEPGELSIITDTPNIPTDDNNIIKKIYNKFYTVTALQREKIRVRLIKKIPSQAGLGGGSSNGAFFLKSLNAHHHNFLNIQNLIKISKEIGADIPFFLKNEHSRVKGIGEVMSKINNNLDCDIILIKPSFGISTGKAYESFSLLKEKKDANIPEIIKGLEENNLDLVNANIQNHLQQAGLLVSQDVLKFEEKLFRMDKNFKMSGSGSCYYLLIKKDESKEKYHKLKENFKESFVYLTDFL